MIHQEQHNAAADIISSSQTKQDIRTKHHQLGSETSCQNISSYQEKLQTSSLVNSHKPS